MEVAQIDPYCTTQITNPGEQPTLLDFEDYTNNVINVQIVLNGIKASAMIDSGSTCSIVSPDLHSKLDLTEDIKIQGPKVPLKLADGSTSIADGKSTFRIQVGPNGKVIQHKMLVANIDTPIILGVDFLIKKKCILDIGNSTLQVNKIKEQIEEVKTETHSVFKISLAEDIKIPRRSEIILPTKTPHKPEFKTGIIEGRKTAINGGAITLGKTVINTDQTTIPLRAVNMSNQVQYIRQNTILGTCEEANILPEADQAKIVNSTQSDTIPEHLHELFNDVNTRISQEQAEIIKALFNKFPDIFSTSDTDLDRTTLVEHEIKLEDPNATPFKKQRKCIYSNGK